MKTLNLFITFCFFSTVLFAQTEKKATSSEDSIKLEIRKNIIKESKVGGKFDVFTPIKGKERDGSQLKPGVYAQNIHIAYFYWAKACAVKGEVNELDDLLGIFEEFRGKKANQHEEVYLKKGFEEGVGDRK